MADGFVAAFQTATGLTVDYKEDFNDNEEWFAKNKEPLSRKQDIGADLVVPTQFLAARLNGLGWLNGISDSRWTNKKNLRPDLLDAKADPGRKFSAPYMSGMTALAYNRAATGRDITKIDDLWDPAFKGKISLLSDMQDGLGMIMHLAGQIAGGSDDGGRAEGRRPDQGAEGQGPDPPLHRQRLRRRPRGGQCRYRPGLFGRRGPAAEGQPGPEVRGAGDAAARRSSTRW